MSVSSVWADENIGNVDGGWVQHHKSYTLAAGKSLTIKFTVNSTKNTADYQGWVTQVLHNTDDMVFFMQPSCGYAVGNWDWNSGAATYNVNNYNWDGTNFRENLQGASVVYNIKRVGSDIILSEDVTTTSSAPSASTKFRHYFVFPYNSNDDLTVVFGADFASLTIKDATTTDTDIPTTYGTLVGAENNTTGWWTAWSDYYSIGANETKTVFFKNYSNKVQNANNWVLFLTSDADRGGDGYEEYLALRSDNWGWGTKYASGTITSGYNWDTFKDELDGATVKMTVARSGGTVTVTANQIAATDGTTVRTETFTFTDNELASSAMRFFLTTEGGHLDLLNDVEKTSSANLQGFKTFYHADLNFEVDANTKIYKALSPSENVVKLTEVEGTIIPAGEPVILKTSNSPTWTLKLTPTISNATGEDFTDNILLAANGGESDVYILAYTASKGGLGFYKYTSPLVAGDVYLNIPATTKSRLEIVIDDEVTGIGNIAVENISNGALFNVAGQRVDANYKGVIIKNGKKYYNK